jgi:type II secretory pathway pseudopilin PulG
MAMIMAIAVIVVVATLLALSLSLTSLTTKSSMDLFLYEQANLLARSAGEYAKLKIGLINNDNNSTSRCAYTGENFTQNSDYNININVSYVYSNGVSACGDIDLVQTDDFGAALIDVTVEVNNPATTSEPIRIFRRKLVEL